MSLLPPPTPCTTPLGVRSYQCPDAPVGPRRDHRRYPDPRRMPLPRIGRRNQSQALSSPVVSSPRQIRPAPAITALSVFTSLAFAESARESEGCQRARKRKGIEGFNQYSNASDIEFEFKSICLNDDRHHTVQDRTSREPTRSHRNRRSRVSTEVLDSKPSDYEDRRIEGTELGPRLTNPTADQMNFINSTKPPPSYLKDSGSILYPSLTHI